MSKRTLNGTKRKAKRTSGFRARMKTQHGRKIIQKRRKKNRQKLSMSS